MKKNIYKLSGFLMIVTYLLVASIYIKSIRQERKLNIQINEHRIIADELQKENEELQGILSTYREKESRTRHCSLEMVECNDSNDEP